jgi:hypothetical protein
MAAGGTKSSLRDISPEYYFSSTRVHLYIYIYMCVCVCVCACVRAHVYCSSRYIHIIYVHGMYTQALPNGGSDPGEEGTRGRGYMGDTNRLFVTEGVVATYIGDDLF